MLSPDWLFGFCAVRLASSPVCTEDGAREGSACRKARATEPGRSSIVIASLSPACRRRTLFFESNLCAHAQRVGSKRKCACTPSGGATLFVDERRTSLSRFLSFSSNGGQGVARRRRGGRGHAGRDEDEGDGRGERARAPRLHRRRHAQQRAATSPSKSKARQPSLNGEVGRLVGYVAAEVGGEVWHWQCCGRGWRGSLVLADAAAEVWRMRRRTRMVWLDNFLGRRVQR